MSEIDELISKLENSAQNLENIVNKNDISEIDSPEITSTIKYDGIESKGIENAEMEAVASNPEDYSQRLETSANIEEVSSGATSGATIGAIFQSIQHSIKILAKVYRGEDVPKEVVLEALKDVMKAAASGALRGALIKVVKIILEKQMEDSSSLPLVIVSTTPIVYKTLLKYLQGEISLEECIKEVGSKTLSRAMIVTMGVIFPPFRYCINGLFSFKYHLERI
ncbi:MAG: hypothetical protein KAG97_03675 [Victivallales bacterium]|nr:hypothetical protein [Victivallales bacterium]